MGQSDQIAPTATEELIALHAIDDEIGNGAAVAYRVSCSADTAIDTAALPDPSSSGQRDQPRPPDDRPYSGRGRRGAAGVGAVTTSTFLIRRKHIAPSGRFTWARRGPI